MTEHLKLKKSNCKNCYKCIRYCPVKAIKITGNQAHIVHEECILCGHCFVACPQDAKEITDGLEKAKVLLQQNERVIVSLAPSFVANYNGVGIKSMEKALRQLGFSGVEETAVGAAIVKKQYETLLKEGTYQVLISSCCASVNLLVQKYYSELMHFLAPVMSPMQAHCRDIKERYPDAKTVFIGPCISKKEEAEQIQGLVDCVLTFEELTKLMAKAGVSFEAVHEEPVVQSRTRIFPTAGGILKSMNLEDNGYTCLSVDGIENCLEVLQDLKDNQISKCFIEMSACRGSCVGGPIMEKNRHIPLSTYLAVNQFAGKEDFVVETPKQKSIAREFNHFPVVYQDPGEGEINKILRKMGKWKPSSELNCGACGYATCKDKAIAVYNGKASINMCLPFLYEKAASFSDNIINNTPNGIIVLNEGLEVQQINASACQILRLRSAQDVLGSPVLRILDAMPFLDVLDGRKNIQDHRVYLAEYGKYVEQTIKYDSNYHILICILRDVTEEVRQHERKEKMSRRTIEIADKVVEKQMRVVQEIASLLGETAAETKIALTKLKESLEDE